MVNKFFKSFLAVAAVLGSALGFVACQEDVDDVVANPTVELSTSSLNFTNDEGSQTVDVKANSDWMVETPEVDWVTVTPLAGNGDKTITVAVSMNDTGKVRSTVIKVVSLHKEWGKWDTKKLTVSQSGDSNVTVDEELLYADNFDGEEATKTYGSGSSWPFIDQFPQFANAEGPAATNVTYSGSGVSVRANSTSNSNYSDYEGSGLNNIFFGSNAYFQIDNIALEASQKSFKMTFGSEKYTQDGDSVFKNSEFHVYLSKNGTGWTEIDYIFAGTEGGRWNVATAEFTLTEVPENLFIKFSADVASVYRLDDVTLLTGNGGQQVTLTDEGDAPIGGDVVKATVAEFLAAAEDNTMYELTGKIANVVASKTYYGNFDLVDETGSVYIYGLVDADNQFGIFEAKGLKEGDTITLRTVRTSYNGKPQGKNATYVSHIPGEGGGETPEPPVAADGDYASDAPFVCTSDDSTNAVYGLGETTINGNAVTGFKLGKSKQTGRFTSGAVGVSGDKYLNFYAVAWKNGDATLYFRVDGGATQSQKLVANNGATGNPDPGYKDLKFAAKDHYSFKLTGLTANSTIEFSTDPNFELTSASSTMSSARAIVCGVKLTDEPVEVGGGDTPAPTPGKEMTIAEAIAEADGANITIVNTTVIGVYARGVLLEDTTGKILVYAGSAVNAEVGDVVKVAGTMATYGGLRQIATPTVEKTGTTTYEYPAVETMDGAAMDAYLSNPTIKYVEYTGTLTINDYYYNVAVAGAATAIGSISYPIEGSVDKSLDGKQVTVKGWTIGFSGGKYVNTMITSVK